MRVLVTGGAGLIGSHTVDRLLAAGHEVRILDLLERPTHATGVPTYLAPEAELMVGDVRDRPTVEKALDGVDALMHLAATGGFTPRLAEYVSSNSLATAVLLETIRERSLPIRKIVVASSIAVYGEGRYRCPEGHVSFPGLRPLAQLERARWEIVCACGKDAAPEPTDEQTPVEPATAYAISKYDQERLVLVFGRETGLPTAALRYFVTYGPRQSLHNAYTGVCTIFATRISNRLPIVVYEDGLQSRDFVYVEDVAAANVFALETDSVRDAAFNVGTGVATPIGRLAELLVGRLGEVPITLPGKFRPADVRHMVADVRALAAHGFRAGTTLSEGLSRYLDWLKGMGPLPEYFGRVEAELRAAGIVRGG